MINVAIHLANLHGHARASDAGRGGCAMKKILLVIPLAFLLCFSVSCQRSQKPSEELKTSVATDVQSIKETIKDWNAAINAADIDRIVSFFADDAVRIPPNEPAAIGKEAIRANYKGMFDYITIHEDMVVRDVSVRDDLAVSHLAFSAMMTLKESGELGKTGKSGNSGALDPMAPIEKGLPTKGNGILVLRKQPSGPWKLLYYIWSDEILVYPK